MLGHVTLTNIDTDHAVSHSRTVIDGLLRRTWGFDGLLITDDLNMGAVYESGIDTVAAEALAAGADLVLISYDPRQVYRVIAGAAKALSADRVAAETLARSKRRLAAWLYEAPGHVAGKESQRSEKRHAVDSSPDGIAVPVTSSFSCSLNCMACRRA